MLRCFCNINVKTSMFYRASMIIEYPDTSIWCVVLRSGFGLWLEIQEHFSRSQCKSNNNRFNFSTIHTIWLRYCPDIKHFKTIVYFVSYFCNNRWHFGEVPNLIMEAIAKHDFTATADDELSFKKNQVLKVSSRLLTRVCKWSVTLAERFNIFGAFRFWTWRMIWTGTELN